MPRHVQQSLVLGDALGCQQQLTQHCCTAGFPALQMMPITGVDWGLLRFSACLQEQVKVQHGSPPANMYRYMENQTTVAEPDEDNGMIVHSATQFYDNASAAVAAALGISNNKVQWELVVVTPHSLFAFCFRPGNSGGTNCWLLIFLFCVHSKVTVKCRRLGGAFGGKALHATKVATAAAVAAAVTKTQVCFTS